MKYRLIIGLLLLNMHAFSAKMKAFNAEKALQYCAFQTNRSLHALMVEETIDYNMMPRNILKGEANWNCRKATKEEWTAGFWPGVLWYDYEFTADSAIKIQAERFTHSLEYLSRSSAYDHDLGFLMFCSYGNAYRLTGNPVYRKVLLSTADTLATLYNPNAGTLLSWPRAVKEKGWPHNTIIDNMMNLELLFWAAKNGGNRRLYDIAVSHANVTMANHFKPDNSCYHVVVYDTVSGQKIKGVTHQGFADYSMWARGQAWAIYGYTVCYRETNDRRYLTFAQQLTDAYLKRLPVDAVPYWDFDAPQISHAPRDASAAAIVASALIELSGYVESNKAPGYQTAAKHMLQSLSSARYQCRKESTAFLKHSTGNLPAQSEIDASMIYADYYYIEALLRWKNNRNTNR